MIGFTCGVIGAVFWALLCLIVSGLIGPRSVGRALAEEQAHGPIVPILPRGYLSARLEDATAVQPDGVMVLLRAVSPTRPPSEPAGAPLLARVHPDGQLNTAFGNGGFVEIDLEGSSTPGPVVVPSLANLTAERLLVAGTYFRDASEPTPDVIGLHDPLGSVALVALRPDGTLDTAFGEGGRVHLGASKAWAPTGAYVASQGAGRAILAWTAMSSDEAHPAAAVCRVLDGGQLDQGFGSGGCTTVSSPSDLTVLQLAVGQDDAITVGANSPAGIALLRLTPDGTPDLTFGNNGVSLIDQEARHVPHGADRLSRLAVAHDGSILFGVTRFLAPRSSELVVVRVSPTGRLDPTFGQDGTLVIGTKTPNLGFSLVSDLALETRCGYALVQGSLWRSGPNTVEVYALDSRGDRIETFGPDGSRVIVVPNFRVVDPGPLLRLGDDRVASVLGLRRSGDEGFALVNVTCRSNA